MGLIAAIAGRYTGTFGASALGLMDDSGYRLTQTLNEKMINRTDAYSEMLIDTIYAGVDYALDMILQEYGTAAMPVVVSPFSTFSQVGVIAQLGTGVAAALVLTAVAATPAAAAPATFTAHAAKQAAGSNTSFNFTSALRVVPVKLTLLPTVVSTVNRHFTTT